MCLFVQHDYFFNLLEGFRAEMLAHHFGLTTLLRAWHLDSWKSSTWKIKIGNIARLPYWFSVRILGCCTHYCPSLWNSSIARAPIFLLKCRSCFGLLKISTWLARQSTEVMDALVKLAHGIIRLGIHNFPLSSFLFKISDRMLAIAPVCHKLLKAFVNIWFCLLLLLSGECNLWQRLEPFISAEAEQTKRVSSMAFCASIALDMLYFLTARGCALIAMIPLYLIASFLQHPHLLFLEWLEVVFSFFRLGIWCLLVEPPSRPQRISWCLTLIVLWQI